jgi:hypothetical protein
MWKLKFVVGAARREYWFWKGACGVGEAVTSPSSIDVQQCVLRTSLGLKDADQGWKYPFKLRAPLKKLVDLGEERLR